MASGIGYEYERVNSLTFPSKSTNTEKIYINTDNYLGKALEDQSPIFRFKITFKLIEIPETWYVPIFGNNRYINCILEATEDEEGDYDGTYLRVYNGNRLIYSRFVRENDFVTMEIESLDYKNYDKYRLNINITNEEYKDSKSYDSNLFFEDKGIVFEAGTPSEPTLLYIGYTNSMHTFYPIKFYNYKITTFSENVGKLFTYTYLPYILYGENNKYKGCCFSAIDEYGDRINHYIIDSHTNESYVSKDYSLDLESATSLTINEGSVAKLQDKDGQILWEAAKHKYKNAYGIRWKNSDVTKVERVGNMNLHKTLPIQTMFKTCCYNHITGDVLYADPNDRRFVTGNDDYSFGVPKAYKVIPNTEYTSTKYYTPFGKPQYIVPLYSGFDGEEGMYLYNYIRVIDKGGHKVVFYVQGLDAENKYLICYYIEGDKTNTNIFNTSSVSTQAASLTVELGFPINGCFGTVMVDTGGSFYLWSEEAATDNDYNYVWISEEKPEGVDAQYNPRTLVSADTVAIKSGEIKASDKNGNVPNDSWGYLGLLDDGASICCRNFSPELRGGDGSANADLMLQPIESGKQPMDYFIALTRQGKPKGVIEKTDCDAAHELNDMTGMSYATYKGIFWLEAIEYASFRYTQDFKDSKNGLKQGGLGKNVITNVVEKTGKDWSSFNNRVPLNTCLSSFDIGEYDCKTAQGTYHLYRNDGICYTGTDRYTFPKSYRGVDWRFGDRRTFLSDITTSTSVTYTYYSEAENQLTETVNCNLNAISSGYYSAFMLGNKADIFPKASSISESAITNHVGYHYLNSQTGYFIVGFSTDPMTVFYRDSAVGAGQIVPNLGTVQQIVIG